MPEQLIPSDAVKAIQDSVKTEVILIGDSEYVTRPVFIPPAFEIVDEIEIHTLTGLIDYLRMDPEFDDHSWFVHVVNPTRVNVVTSPIGIKQRRATLVAADCSAFLGDGFRFKQYMPVEDFIVNLQSQFIPSDERDDLLRMVSSITFGATAELEDDGVSQTALVRKGASVTRLERKKLNPLWLLNPYRTFPEVDQPESTFVYRHKGGKDEKDPPLCALFPADGGLWKVHALQKIKQYLEAADIAVPILA